MKRIATVVLAAAMAWSLTACGTEAEQAAPETSAAAQGQ